jgi:hypothetical protein
VLRGQRCPAILDEGGYLSNPGEARRIADPAYRQKLAEAVAEALLPERGPAAREFAGANGTREESAVHSPQSSVQSPQSTVHDAGSIVQSRELAGEGEETRDKASVTNGERRVTAEKSEVRNPRPEGNPKPEIREPEADGPAQKAE